MRLAGFISQSIFNAHLFEARSVQDRLLVRPSNGFTKPKLRSSLDEVDRIYPISRWSPIHLRSFFVRDRSLSDAFGTKKRSGFSAGTLFSSQGATRLSGVLRANKNAGEEHRRAIERPGQQLAQVPKALLSLRAPAWIHQSGRMPTSCYP